LARELNPRGIIAARANYLAELPALRGAGADLVFSGEGEVALSMTGSLLERLGATPDQIDRERDRIRSELFHHPDDAAARAPGAGEPAR
jgi:CPA2 family monovalent cation:H+ antiporter-2